MGRKRRHGGFSLIEVLLAVGTLAMGMMFIAGTFLVALHLTTVSTERTIASVVANEALSKVSLFSVDITDANLAFDRLTRFEMLRHPNLMNPFDPNEYAYPSTAGPLADKQYYWSALCRRTLSDPNYNSQVTVFVSRKVGFSTLYEGPAGPAGPKANWPIPVQVGVTGLAGSFVLAIESGREKTINDGYTVVENSSGEIYRVIERGAGGAPANEIALDKPWNPAGTYPDPAIVWVVPPPVTGGKGPCIAVYQKLVRF